MAAQNVEWWKFDLPGLGTHHVHVKDIGTGSQDVSIDGSPVLAPPDQMTFTGPGGALLELQRRSNGWILLVDGQYAQSGRAHQGISLTWKFEVTGAGTHQLRMRNVGESSEEVFLDGVPIEAPPGTTTFTGPAATLLEIGRGSGSPESWSLHVDGTFIPQVSEIPGASRGTQTWDFELPGTGSHQLVARNLGLHDEQVLLDGVPFAAPPGTTTFTGPAGTLLQLQSNGEAMQLYVDGVPIPERGEQSMRAIGDALWSILVKDPSKTYTAIHEMKVLNIGTSSQQVWIDGVLIAAPEGTTTFTGPGGCLLSIQAMPGAYWNLLVDGVPFEEHNAIISAASSGETPPAARQPVAPLSMVTLPQGVSFDQATGRYVANIRSHGRFVCLGDFATPEEASIRYQEAKAKQ
mmetsp:Transcript_15825/g.25163  ORF Transcript_15825/g.25163 Transcript_15825/m.25163 type:complete len:405 (-) Transcript_15825:64-1278(-)